MTGFLVVRSTEAAEGLGRATSHGVSRERKKGREKGVEKVEGWAERVAPSLRLYKSPDYAWLFNERRVSRIFTARNGSSRLAGSKAGKLNISLVRFKHDSEFPPPLHTSHLMKSFPLLIPSVLVSPRDRILECRRPTTSQLSHDRWRRPLETVVQSGHSNQPC